MRHAWRGKETSSVLAACVIAGVALLSAACGSATPSTTPSQPAATTPSASPSPSPSPSPSAGVLTVQQGAGGALVFSPSKFSVKTGDQITLDNVGITAHTFTIAAKNINVVNSPGQSQPLVIHLPPGTYPFVCTFHISQGMKGMLTVTG